MRHGYAKVPIQCSFRGVYVHLEPSRGILHRNLALLAGLTVLLLGLGLGWAWKQGRQSRTPIRVLLVTPPPAPDAGIDHYEARAITTAFQDLLEVHPQGVFTPATVLPSSQPSSPSLQGPWIAVVLEPARRGNTLAMALRWSRQVGPFNPAAHWHPASLGGDTHQIVLQRAAEALSFLPATPAPPRLLPQADTQFWAWVKVEGLRLRNPAPGEGIEEARRLVDLEGASSEAWVTWTNLLYRFLMNAPEKASPTLSIDIQSGYRRALELTPTFPRAAFLLAQVHTTMGAHQDALDGLLAHLRQYPNHPLLLSGVASSARCAGLLDLANQARKRRDRSTFQALQPVVVDLTLLYTGEWTALEESLVEMPGHLRQSIILFYKGYVALLQGRRLQALEHFKRVQEVPAPYANYARLALAFQRILEGREAEGREVLQAFRHDRVGLKVLDGELTFRLAEAAALLGDQAEAVDLLRRSYAQGFGCVAWYERSPLLGGLRENLSFQSLLHQVRERQEFFKRRYAGNPLPD